MARTPKPAPTAGLGPLALAVGVGRQIGREWRVGAIHHLAIGGPRPKGLATKPKDFRPASAATGERLLQGQFRFHGEVLAVAPGGDPWDRPAPSLRFARTMHGFRWMADLLAAGEAGAREALRLWLDWRRLFGPSNAFAWTGEALERRVFNLTCAAPALAQLASDLEIAALLADLAHQARHLLAEPGDPDRALERTAAAALAGAALAGAAGERLLRKALPSLEKLAPQAVLADGVHATRSPERGMEVLFDFLALDDALSQRGRPLPVEMARAMDRLSGAVQFFAAADGRLPEFHGGEGGAADRVAAALALEPPRKGLGLAAPYGGYERMEGRGIDLIADVAAPAARAWSVAACAQPAAIEVVCDGRRLIRSSVWSALAPPSAAVLRGPGGGSGMAVGEIWPGAPLTGFRGTVLGDRLIGGAAAVTVERNETADGVWLDISHDGWRRPYGLIHTRRLFLDLTADEVRGEDELTPADRRGGGRRLPYAVRFQLMPLVSVQLAVDGKSALIKPAGAPGWRLRSDAAEIRLEPTQAFDDGEGRLSQAVVLAGVVSPANGGRVRWKLSRAET